MKKNLLMLTLAASLAVTALPLSMAQANGITSAAAAAQTMEDAQKKAAALLPKGSQLLHSEVDDGQYELKYYNSTTKTMYKIEISTTTGNVTKVETQLNEVQKSSPKASVLTEDAIKKIITSEIKDATILSTKLSMDDGVQEYEVDMKTSTLYGKYEINAQTGAVLEREIKIGSALSLLNPNNYISLNAVTNKALSVVPKGIVTDIEIKTKNGQPAYKVEVYTAGVEHKLYIHAVTGELITHSSHKDSWEHANYNLIWDYNEYTPLQQLPGEVAASIISYEKAASIVQAKAPKAKLVEMELDTDDGKSIYEGTLKEGNIEYEFELDAKTGKIIDWEVDIDD